MIGYIQGKIITKDLKAVTVLTGAGVGYRVSLSLLVSSQLELEQDVAFHVYTHFRQDTLELYGFLDQETKQFFEALIGINGVGPKLALDVLAAPLNKVKEAIEMEDTVFLKSIKGLGKKTAERIILELKGKLPKSLAEDEEGIPGRVTGDVVEALINLGYKRQHISDVFRELPEPIKSPEAMIRYFLQNV